MIEVLLTSSVLILALALLRRGLRGRIDPRLQYALWLLVVLRLLIPGSLFPAPLTCRGPCPTGRRPGRRMTRSRPPRRMPQPKVRRQAPPPSPPEGM